MSSAVHRSNDSPANKKRRPIPLPKKSTVYDCPYPLESINQQLAPETMDQQSRDARPSASDYECIYFPARDTPPVNPWQYSPLYGVNPAYYPAGFYPVQVDPWGQPISYRPVPSPSLQVKSFSMDRLNTNPVRPQVFPVAPFGLRSPNPSPVHTPSGSPILNRARFSPSPGASPSLNPRNNNPTARRVLPGGSPVLPPKGTASKPPKPRQRPPLQKAKTIDDYPDDVTSLGIRGSSPQRANQSNIGSKIPSLDSLYEQLKVFAAAPMTAPPLMVGSDNPADQIAVVSDGRERAGTYSGAPLAYRSNFKPDVEERLQRLEGDKDSLQMQVSVLMEQIDAQTEKIHELEKTLSEKTSHLQRAEDLLQKELMSRSSMETHKLELLSEMSSFKLRYAALERENMDLRGQLKRSEQDMLTLVGQCYSLCGATLGPGANRKEMIEALKQNLRSASASPQQRPPPAASTTPLSAAGGTSQARKGSLPASPSISSLPPAQTPQQPQQSVPTVETTRPSPAQVSKTPPASVFRRVEPDPFNSLPRQNSNSNSNSNTNGGQTAAASTLTTPKRTVVFAESEKNAVEPAAPCADQEDTISEATSPISVSSPSQHSVSKNSKGFKKIFDKLKRSNSGALEGEPTDGDLRRGGTRATSGPRLGWNGHAESPVIQSREPQTAFSDWTTDEVCTWLHEMGLHMYVYEAQRWISAGQVLLNASPGEMEKELGIKHPLHKKKIILALEAKGRPVDLASPILPLPDLMAAAGKLDHQWVVRWLDDIGLPQYKDAFLEARIDGRMLHALSVDDLCVHLKVSNLLHVTSIKRGIQVLRLKGYSPGCLKRRSVPEDSPHPTAADVALWTNHRVMEWLRAVDLSEYAPNMRGSGIHGGLMVYEPRFTAELLATLLSIPQGKTLLRRHLATHFNQLMGRDIVQAKRETENSPTSAPLSALTKVKVIKKTQFTLKRRKGKTDEYEADDWVCPADVHDAETLKTDVSVPPNI